jgi:hypothetical protein
MRGLYSAKGVIIVSRQYQSWQYHIGDPYCRVNGIESVSQRMAFSE